MSSRGPLIPKDLADPPANPFQPVLPAPGTANRRPIVRRAPASAPSRPAPAPKPFGEIGKEDDDNFDTASVLSAGWTDNGEPLDDEMVKTENLPVVTDAPGSLAPAASAATMLPDAALLSPDP
ncbi:uncharacterized protein JCM10292_005555 [Rhodotorula paludigena]|uniref:uncharacterized protein n=1 Tax=Rhodotorula paludigena TaxID=86838 RepID=UPI003178497E